MPDAPTLESLAKSLDTVFVLVAAMLVFFMQAGFGMVEAGLTRAKNAASILMKNFVDFCIATFAFTLVGFRLLFGTDAAGAAPPGLAPEAFLFFQVAFAGAAATIVAGAVCERMKLAAYLLFSLVMSGLIYPVAAGWLWGPGGFLAERGAVDFAGSIAVHLVGGAAALAGAIAVGARHGRYLEDGRVRPMPGHNLGLTALGTLILWLGWFGFNPGSALSASRPDLVAHVAVTTNLGAAAGAIAALAVTWVRYGKPDPSLVMNGALAGLVAVTAGCAFLSSAAAAAVGAIGAVLATFAVELLDRARVDDPVGAVPVHLVNGAWGGLAVGVFGPAPLGAQALAVLSVLAFVLVASFAAWRAIDRAVGLRVPLEAELVGLDLAEHRTRAYPEFEVTAVERIGAAPPSVRAFIDLEIARLVEEKVRAVAAEVAAARAEPVRETA